MGELDSLTTVPTLSAGGRTEITYSGPVPAGVSKAQVLELLHNHAAYFRAAEHYKEHQELADDGTDHRVPAEIQSRSTGDAVKMYTVRNEVPNPVRDSKVESKYEVVDLTDGLWYRAASPMAVVNEGLWSVTDHAPNAGWVLTVRILVECNIVLKALVKGNVQSNAEQIHKSLISSLQT